ncbi:hypothetical protein ACLG6S_14025 [Thermodesulfobacteriota bacterium B35]
MLKTFGVRWWVAVCVVVGLWLTLGCYFPWRLESQIAADPGVARGRIDGSVLERVSKRAANWLVSYSFEVDGKRYANRVSVSSAIPSERVRPGREISVRYCCFNPLLNQPDIVQPRLAALRLGLAAGLICLFGGIVLAAGDLTGHPMLVFSGRGRPRPADQELPALPPPAGFSVLAEDDKKLVIRYRRLNGRVWLRLAGALFFPVLLTYQVWLWRQCPNPDAMNWFFRGIALLAILGCLSYAVVLLCGRIVITATRSGVEVVSRHIAVSSFTIRRRVLERFISQPRMRPAGRHPWIILGQPASMRPTGWHKVKAVCNLAADKVIVRNCSSEEGGRWLAAKLNAFFGIQDG